QLGDLASVAAAAEGAVDGGLARLGRQQRDKLGGEDGLVLAHDHLDGTERCPARGLDIFDLPRIQSHDHAAPAPARPSAISGAAASSSSSCFAQASAFQISRYSPAPMTTQLPSSPACSTSGLGMRMRPAESSVSSKEPP